MDHNTKDQLIEVLDREQQRKDYNYSVIALRRYSNEYNVRFVGWEILLTSPTNFSGCKEILAAQAKAVYHAVTIWTVEDNEGFLLFL